MSPSTGCIDRLTGDEQSTCDTMRFTFIVLNKYKKNKHIGRVAISKLN